MCGIIAVMARPARRPPPAIADLATALRHALTRLEPALGGSASALAGTLDEAAEGVEVVDRSMRGTPGVRALLGDRAGVDELEQRLDDLRSVVDRLDNQLDADAIALAPGELEAVNTAMVRLKDAVWAARHDRFHTVRAVADLVGANAGPAAIAAFTGIQIALASIDRLEVRGRDSAGLHVLVRDHALDLDDPTVARLIAERSADPLFRSGSVRVDDGCVGFVYKAAAEIGDLGDNTAALRGSIRDDLLLHLAVAGDAPRAVVLGHTRWASVGIISEANAHPLDAAEERGPGELDVGRGPGVIGVLNGDVDNHADLKAFEELAIPPEITTDAKVIPTLVSRRIAAGLPLEEAFRVTVSSLEGSVAIAVGAVTEPDRLTLALRGSGQALYVGLAEDAFVVASEPYGIVEETPVYLRMDGDTPNDPAHPAGSRGQIVVLDAERAGTIEGIRRLSYDGTELPVTESELQHAEITTRDIDRGDAPHFLLKEIAEAPSSFRKTLRGKITERDGHLVVELGPETLPDTVRERLRSGAIRRVLVVGQGTAAVAGQSLATALERALDGRGMVTVESLPATELSGFGLEHDMSDTLVVAISQSGTTTDTNRTVDLVRSRGASVIAIVNRRNSDLVDRSDGVLYTSDGRDVEMSVASTKAFYAQIAAGFLLAFAIAAELGASDPEASHELLVALRELPDAMARVIDLRPIIAAAAQRHAPGRRSWAVVGNGVNRIAANEVRIKLSELCYKSIACDVTEDKKHIDLSSEPLIVVCAAGLAGGNADDVAKELAIYRAHKAAPIVIANEGEARFQPALETIEVPAVHPAVAFVLCTVAGHLFGYEAALAIDASARPLREARAAIEAAVSAGRNGRQSGRRDDLLEQLADELEPVTARFFDGLRSGTYDGSLEAATAVRVASLLRYAMGVVPLESYQVEYGKVGTPSVVVEDLTAALTRGIEELTRPVDAIKHQAKTVTVGISRSDETLLQVPLVQEVLAAGVARDNLSYRALRTLVDLDAAVEQVTGFTRYRVEGDVGHDGASIHVVDRGGLGAELRSRTDADPRLRGTKQIVAVEREVTVARGRSDGRMVVLVPEVKGTQTIGLTLLHVRFHDLLPAEVARGVLQGYRNRYTALKGAVTETEPGFDDAVLSRIDVAELLTEPVYVLADRWRPQ